MSAVIEQSEVRVPLTPDQAKVVAEEIGFLFAGQVSDAAKTETGAREDVARVRAILETHEALMDSIKWGESSPPVELVYLEDRVKELCEYLYEIGGQRLARPQDTPHVDEATARRQGLAMVQAADAMHAALTGEQR